MSKPSSTAPAVGGDPPVASLFECVYLAIVVDYTDLPFFWVNRVSFALRKELSRRFTDAGHAVGPEEWAVLLVLWSKGPQTPSTLSEQTIRDRTTVTRLIDGMVRKGLVARSENPTDRRRTDISLTPTGEALEADLVPLAIELIGRVSAGIAPQDLETTRQTLRALSENLASLPDPPPASSEGQL